MPGSCAEITHEAAVSVICSILQLMPCASDSLLSRDILMYWVW